MKQSLSILAGALFAATAPSQNAPPATTAVPEIVTIPIEDATSIAVVLGVRAGVFDELDGWNGAAHLVEHLVLHSPAGDVDDPFAVLSAGGPLGQAFVDCNAETMWQGTYFYSLRPAPRADGNAPATDPTDLERTLGLFADLLHRSSFDERTLDQERPRAVAEVQQVATSLESNPRLRWLLERQARMPKAGTEADMQGLTLDELVAFRRVHYRPERCVLIVAGKIDGELVAELARRVFAQRAVPLARAGQEPALLARPTRHERIAAVRSVAAPEQVEQRIATQLAAEVCARRLREAEKQRRASDADEATASPTNSVWVETPADGSLRIAIARRGVAEHQDAAAGAAAQKLLEQTLVASMRSLASDPPSEVEVSAARRTVAMPVRQRLLSAQLGRVPAGDAGHRALLQSSIDRLIAELAGGIDFVDRVHDTGLDAVRAAGRRLADAVVGDATRDG